MSEVGNNYKKVLLEIEVPESIYCYSYPRDILCNYFGLGSCSLGFNPEYHHFDEYKKPKECLTLLQKTNTQ